LINTNYYVVIDGLTLYPLTMSILVMESFILWCYFQECPWEKGTAPAESAGQGKVVGLTHRMKTAQLWAKNIDKLKLVNEWVRLESHESAQDSCKGICKVWKLRI